MKDIFAPEVLQGVDTSKSEIHLSEPSNRHKRKILVSGIPGDAILLKLDIDKKGFKSKSNFLNKSLEFIHKGCDYCLICPSLKKIFFIELKTSETKGFEDQLLASELFIDYCLRLWKNYTESTDYSGFEKFYILFSEKHSLQPPSSGEILKKFSTFRCGQKFLLRSPGFPKRIKIQKLMA